MSFGLTLTKNISTPLAKSVLVPLGLTAAASAANTATQKTIYGSSMTALVFSNEWYPKKKLNLLKNLVYW